MLNKDKVLLEEAYLSATNKLPATPADKEVEHDTDSDIEEPMVITIGGMSDSEETPETIGGDNSTWQEHENEEIRMVKTNLYTLFEDAKMLHDCIHEGEVLEPWMYQKIAVASEMICGVAKVVRYCQAKSQASL